jgi:hypothetical protein
MRTTELNDSEEILHRGKDELLILTRGGYGEGKK